MGIILWGSWWLYVNLKTAKWEELRELLHIPRKSAGKCGVLTRRKKLLPGQLEQILNRRTLIRFGFNTDAMVPASHNACWGSTKVWWSHRKIAAPIVSLNKGSASPWLPRIKISGSTCELQLEGSTKAKWGWQKIPDHLYFWGRTAAVSLLHCISNISMWWSRIILGYWDIDPSNDQCKRLSLDDIDRILKSHSRQWPRQVQRFRGFKSTRIMP